MEVFQGIEKVCRPLKNPAITIGNFDGVHRGHQALFQKVKECARELGGESVVVTFDPHPLQVLAPEKGLRFITPYPQKLRFIEASGIDVTIVIPFSIEFSQLSAREFVETLLVDGIGAKAIVVGYDYRFGSGREGNINFLKKMGEEFFFKVYTVPGLEIGGTVVSSTSVRLSIQEGDVTEARRLLGRPYEIVGTVVEGRNRGGRLLGYPTANIRLSTQACPKPGVYAVEVEVRGGTYGGAANLGYNPTFGDTDLSLEVYIFDFSEDIYGEGITVKFMERLRDEKRFSNVEELARQIGRDVEKAKSVLSGPHRSEAT